MRRKPHRRPDRKTRNTAAFLNRGGALVPVCRKSSIIPAGEGRPCRVAKRSDLRSHVADRVTQVRWLEINTDNCESFFGVNLTQVVDWWLSVGCWDVIAVVVERSGLDDVFSEDTTHSRFFVLTIAPSMASGRSTGHWPNRSAPSAGSGDPVLRRFRQIRETWATQGKDSQSVSGRFEV